MVANASFENVSLHRMEGRELADSEEVRASHQYIEVLATQQGAKVRAFSDEPRALNWLAAQSQE